MQLHFSGQLTDELKQKQAVTENLIKRIIFSKRLLVDHVEALEQCMELNDRPLRPSINGSDETDGSSAERDGNGAVREIFTARNTYLVVGTTILEHFIIPKSLRMIMIPSMLLAGGFSALYLVKSVFGFRNKIVEREVENLICAIDAFGNCIRRNMTYFNEIIIMKQAELIESRQIERAWDCITAAKEVTEILYDATRKLEEQYPIPENFSQYYAPMEMVRECEYFKNNVTDYSPKHIKDFHNIFAYVQSQFLLRLALTLTTHPSISAVTAEMVKIDCLIRQLVQEEENHFKNLSVELNKKKQLEIESLHAAKAVRHRGGPTGVLQDCSLKLSARMVAVAGECQALDITLQRLTATEMVKKKDNAKQLVEVANNMRAIESTLGVCCDDFQRLMLVYNKFLSAQLDGINDKTAKMKQALENAPDDEFPESFLRVEISQELNEVNDDKLDDFYAYMFDQRQTKEEQPQQLHQEGTSSDDREILNFEKRITKGKFRPVLRQLKDRIDPIRQVMLDREREVLTAKGINVDELFRQEKHENEVDTHHQHKVKQSDGTNSGSDNEDTGSEGSAEIEFQRRSKKLKERDNFAEMRNFLAQKGAINIYNVDAAPTLPKHLPQVAGEEEILESEC